MIARDSLIEIGRFAKPHGINGELTATIDYEGLDTTALRCIFCDIDGIPVPFFVEAERPKGSSALLTIEGISDERQAAMLSLKPIFALKDDLDIDENENEDGWYAEALVGFTVKEQDMTVGKITDIDFSTLNYLFIVERPDGSTVRIPVADEFITAVAEGSHVIEMALPDGLLDL